MAPQSQVISTYQRGLILMEESVVMDFLCIQRSLHLKITFYMSYLMVSLRIVPKLPKYNILQFPVLLPVFV